MAKKVRTQSQVKKKKKMWVQINSPKLFGQKKIGETFVYAPGDANGKTIEQNLMALTGDMKRQNITVKFQVEKVTGSVAQTKIVSYTMAPTYIKRLVRRRRDRIDFSKVYLTKDNYKVRLKPLLITTTKTRGSTLTTIRRNTHALLTKRVKQLKLEELIQEIIAYRLQSFLKNNLKLIHPLRNCEIRVFKLEKDVKKDSVEVVDESVEEEETKEEPVKEEKETKSKKTEKKKEVKEEEKPVPAKDEDLEETAEEDSETKNKEE